MQSSAGTVDASQEPLVFTGKTDEYFRIWIVNTALSIVTLGIYYAWAKVRTRKYFYRNTLIMGDSFDYHANPMRILRGHLIAVVIMAPYAVISYMRPDLAIVYFILIALAIPVLWVQSRIFNLSNSSYRGIRFAFLRDYKGAYAAIIKGMAVTLFTLGFAAGYAEYYRARFNVDNSSWGKSKFTYTGRGGAFVELYLIAFFITLGVLAVVFVIFFLVMMVLGGLVQKNGAGSISSAVSNAVIVAVYVLLVFAYAAPFAYLSAGRQNLTINGARFGSHTMSSDVKTIQLMKLYLSNLFFIMVSFGLLIPWAKIRVTRYRLSKVCLHLDGELRTRRGDDESSDGAMADTLGDALSLDFGL